MDDEFAVVRSKFNLEALKPFQEETIRELLKGRDSFVSIKTGGGKSSFQAMWAEFHKCECSVLVVAPLISIMKEQSEYLKSSDFIATYIGRDPKEETDIINGRFQFFFNYIPITIAKKKMLQNGNTFFISLIYWQLP